MENQKILDTLSFAENILKEAKNRFNEGNLELQSKASKSIDLFGGTAVSQVAEITKATRTLCEKFYATCQTQVKIIDETCRPLLTDDIPATTVRAVWQMICKLNEESDISVDFTASLNSTALGDVAAIQYSPTMDSKMIQSYWESKYKSCPGRKELEKAEAEEKKEKENKAKQAAAKRKESEEEEYKRLLEKWEKKAATITEKREKLFNELLEKEREKITNKIEDTFNQTFTELSEKKEQYLEERTEAEQLLAETPAFSIFKKYKFKKHIEDLTIKINLADQEIEKAKKTRTAEKRKRKKLLEAKKEEIQATVKKKYRMPRKPRMPLSMRVENPTPMMMANEDIKIEILNTLEKHGRLSREQLMKKCAVLAEFTEQRVVNWTKELMREGEIIITETRTDSFPYVCVYYELAE